LASGWTTDLGGRWFVEGVVILPGAYNWLRYRVEVGSAAKRKLSGQATWW
jgi:hypothetical protein